MSIAPDEQSTYSTTLPVSVITTCYGRNQHLYNLLGSLMHGSVRPAEVIIVNDDADPKRLSAFSLNIVQIPTTTCMRLDNDKDQPDFDIGCNRNLGAAKASYDALIFLDVDCIIAPTFIEQFYAKLQSHPDALLMGQPRYLLRPLTDTESSELQQGILPESHLSNLSVYNPHRYNFEPTCHVTIKNDIEQTQDYGAFWSLCFAINNAQFDKIGGFDMGYIGYGAEDTDFAFTARELAIDFYLTADVVYHQQHSVYRPPLNHLASIIINANRFYEKWQHWAMAGWLADFANMGLIEWQSNQTNVINILRQPNVTEIKDAHYPDAPFV